MYSIGIRGISTAVLFTLTILTTGNLSPSVRWNQEDEAGKWTKTAYYGVNFWVAANNVNSMLMPEWRNLLLFVSEKDFTEENLTNIFKGLATEYPSPETLSVWVFTDKDS
jgi:hypothetical protein